jgi:PAS domain-containing protein
MIMRSLTLDRIETESRMLSRVIVSLVVMLAISTLAAFTFFQVDRELQRSKTANSDNRTWVLAQIEVDLQNLEIALLKAGREPGPENIEALRLAYDIVYSRVLLVQRAPTMDELSLRQTEAWNALVGDNGLIQQFVPLIDGSDQTLIAALPAMAVQTSEIRLSVREVIVRAFAESLKFGDVARQGLRDTLYVFIAALSVSTVGLAMFLTTIYRQARAQQRYAKMLELAVHNLQATIETARDAVLIINADDAVIGANKAGEAMLGRTPSAQAPIALKDILVALVDDLPLASRNKHRDNHHGNRARLQDCLPARHDPTAGS